MDTAHQWIPLMIMIEARPSAFDWPDGCCRLAILTRLPRRYSLGGPVSGPRHHGRAYKVRGRALDETERDHRDVVWRDRRLWPMPYGQSWRTIRKAAWLPADWIEWISSARFYTTRDKLRPGRCGDLVRPSALPVDTVQGIARRWRSKKAAARPPPSKAARLVTAKL